MHATEPLPLRMAVIGVLRRRGTRVLEEPSQFMSNVLDIVDEGARTTLALRHNCDEEFLDIFVQASMTRTPQSMKDAAHKAEFYLRDECIIQDDAAQQVACEITFALSNHLGVVCPEWIRLVAIEADGATKAEKQRAPHSSGKENEAAAAKPQTKSTHSEQEKSTASTLDVASLSTDPTKRQQAIEGAGIGMHWFELLKWGCWLAAAMRLMGALSDFAAMMSIIGELESIMAFFLGSMGFFSCIDGLMQSGMCVGYLASWNRLRGFRENGPKTLYTTLSINVFYPLFALAWRWTILGSCGLASEPNVQAEFTFSLYVTLFYTVINALVWLGSYRYFKKRKQFFNLP